MAETGIQPFQNSITSLASLEYGIRRSHDCMETSPFADVSNNKELGANFLNSSNSIDPLVKGRGRDSMVIERDLVFTYQNDTISGPANF